MIKAVLSRFDSGASLVRANVFRPNGLKFKAGLASGEVKDLDGIGVIPVFLPCELVETGQADDFVVKIRRHNFTPEFI